MITLQTMPQEILIGILKKLDQKSLCSLGGTCSLFYLLSADHSLWNSFLKERFPQLTVECSDKHTYIKCAKEEHAHFVKWKLFIENSLHHSIPQSIKLNYSTLYHAHKAALISLGKLHSNALKIDKEFQLVHEEILASLKDQIKQNTRTVYFGRL